MKTASKKWTTIIGVIVSLLCMPLYGAQAAQIALEGPAEAAVGEVFAVDLTIDAATDLYGLAVDLTYDASALSVNDADPSTPGVQPHLAEGTALNGEGATPTILRSGLENGHQGILVLGDVREGPVSGITLSEKSTLLTVYFKADAEGLSEIGFGHLLSRLSDSDRNPIPVDGFAPASIWVNGFVAGLPHQPEPFDGSQNEATNPTLTWRVGEPDAGVSFTYDVYFGEVSNPPLAATGLNAPQYSPGELDYAATYYWRVVTQVSDGGSFAGPEWRFTTFSADGDADADGLTNQRERDVFGTDPFDADTDDDGVRDANDSDPLDAGNAGPVIALPENELDAGQYGYKWGTGEHYSILAATFWSNGQDRFLHAQSYDMDYPDEIAIYLNGFLIGYLSGGNDVPGPDSLWSLPAGMQREGENRIEFRLKQNGWKWGVQRLGLFDPGADFGNLKTLAGGDTDHPDGVELHFQGGESRLVELVGFDSDSGFPNEILLTLNGAVVGGLPVGPDEGWTEAYHLYLPEAHLDLGDNILLISNQYNATYNWGVRIDAMRVGNAGLGKNSGHVDEVNYLVPVGANGGNLTFEGYDVDFGDEIEIMLNGDSQGFVNGACDNTWCPPQNIGLAPDQLAAVSFDNAYNPPNIYQWGVRIAGLTEAADADGDGLSDDLENASCTDAEDADTDADGVPDGVEDANQNGVGDEGETDPCDADSDDDGLSDGEEESLGTDPLNPDTDGDGSPDNVDPDPLDPAVYEIIVSLPENELDVGQYGWNWGSEQHKEGLTAVFQSNGADRLLHVQSYDIDFPDEAGVYLNGNFLGYLTGADNALGADALWYLPADLQTIGENTIEFRQKTPGWKWGVTRLGIYDMGSAFGNLKTLAGGDTDHPDGVELHFQGGEPRVINLVGFDSDADYPNEIQLALNGATIGGLPAGPDGGWTDPHALSLTVEELDAGDNILRIENQYNPDFNWGVEISGIARAPASCDLVLPVNELDAVDHGWNWGDGLYKEGLTVCFTGDGNDRLLHVQSYDIDFPDEVGVHLNGNFLGYLTGENDALGSDALWLLPKEFQESGQNVVEFRQKTAGWKWGATRLGIFDIGFDFGNLKTMTGGDIEHPEGVEIHFSGGDAKLIEMVGFDSDAGYPDEIQLTLNGTLVGGLPEGPDGGWTSVYHLYLPSSALNSGDNALMIDNQYNAAFNWGVRINGISSGDAPLGKGVPGTTVEHINEAVYLIPMYGTSGNLDIGFYDADFADEIQVFVDGTNAGFASVTPDNGWGTTESVSLPVKEKLSIVKIDCTYNPPNAYIWGTRIVQVQLH